MSRPFTDSRPLWIQAAEQHELECAVNEAIATELADLAIEEPADDVAPLVPHPSHPLRSRATSLSPLRFGEPNGAPLAHRRTAPPPAARSP
ncbi:hypothetical protein FK529_10370 [Tsukamurella asaccharolytica]|uniref:Uncharacterized protein n=1 Tax=Tsukamurella asaccharolytica TaxID=2592067 RepID=A0A5C5RBT5_9ACTN|nr:hypothetical protein [Tsukamurella asaccharolytica]TWS19581.1 hypothetical protein FK529_10370 [Tsukamurella asaccharolytica]